jgi:hypothetical protein
MPSTIDQLAGIIQRKFESTEQDIQAKMKYLKTQSSEGQIKENRDAAAQGCF